MILPIFKNSKGFSLGETAIALGLTGFIGLGVMQMMKGTAQQKKAMNQDSQLMSVVKLMEGKIMSAKGCQSLVGKQLGDTVTLPPPGGSSSSGESSTPGTAGQDNHTGQGTSNTTTPAPQGNYGATSHFVSINSIVANMAFSDFIPSDTGGDHGLGKITTTLELNEKTHKVDTYIPLSMENGRIKSCNMSYIGVLEAIKDEVCEKVYGTVSASTPNKTCPEAVLEVWRLIADEICDEIYGTGNHSMNGRACNLALLHEGKKCNGNRSFNGFDSQGNPDCIPNVTAPYNTGGTSSGSTTAGTTAGATAGTTAGVTAGTSAGTGGVCTIRQPHWWGRYGPNGKVQCQGPTDPSSITVPQGETYTIDALNGQGQARFTCTNAATNWGTWSDTDDCCLNCLPN